MSLTPDDLQKLEDLCEEDVMGATALLDVRREAGGGSQEIHDLAASVKRKQSLLENVRQAHADALGGGDAGIHQGEQHDG